MCNNKTMLKTTLQLICLCVIFLSVVFAFHPSPFAFGLLTGLLTSAAFIVGSNDGMDHVWQTIFEVQRQMEEDARKVIDQKYATKDEKHVQ